MLLQLSFALLPVAASCGWWMGRKEHQRLKKDSSGRFHLDYFKGLNYLINEEPDKAVDVFIKLLEVDGDTVETHLALGNLFRRRGEVDRAIRVHQNLIARPELSKYYRVQALSALGQDYLSAGVLDRAERLFLELVDMSSDNESSLRFLLRIYQQEKDWEKAIKITKKLQGTTAVSLRPVIAHYYCELAEQMIVSHTYDAAFSYLKKSLAADDQCVRASMLRAELEYQAGRYKEAIRAYKRVRIQDSAWLSEIIEPIVKCYKKLGEEPKLLSYLYECLHGHPRVSLVFAISDYLRESRGDKAAIEFVAVQIQRHPSLRGLQHLAMLYIANSGEEARDKLEILNRFIENLMQDKPVYRCGQCGFSAKLLFWLCPSCLNWNSVKPIQGLEGS